MDRLERGANARSCAVSVRCLISESQPVSGDNAFGSCGGIATRARTIFRWISLQDHCTPLGLDGGGGPNVAVPASARRIPTQRPPRVAREANSAVAAPLD